MSTKKQYHVAVIGATGNIGREIIKILNERSFPIRHLSALASRSSVGKEISFNEHQSLTVQDLETFSFDGVDIVLASAGSEISKRHARRVTDSGAVYIDNSSCFRMDKDVPLVVPEVNPEAARDWKKRGIIANPNCSTIQLTVALHAIHELFEISQVHVATYQSVSGAGKKAMDELYEQTRKLFFAEGAKPEVFNRQIAFNIIPQIDVAMGNGQFKEEWKMQVETQKIMDSSFDLHVICARVPVFISHSEAVFVTCRKPVSIPELAAKWRKNPGLTYLDDRDKENFATPKETAGDDDVYCSRLLSTKPNQLQFWCVSDNLRKGGALNAVQIAELLIKKDWLTLH